MADETIVAKSIQVRRATAAIATANNKTLAAGEIGFETDTRKWKFGDGSTAWNSLPYAIDEVGHLVEGRLTLTSGESIPSSDVTAAGTLYFTLHNGNRIRIYDGSDWVVHTFAELSLSLSITAGKNYDVFIYDDAGTLTLELSAAWTNDTTRADALVLQDGVYVKSGTTTRLHLGTIRASGANVTEDSGGHNTRNTASRRFVWNRYNQVEKICWYHDNNSHAYNSATYRNWNNDANVAIELLCGDYQDCDTLVYVRLQSGNAGDAAYAGTSRPPGTAYGFQYVQTYDTELVGTSVSNPIPGVFGYEKIGVMEGSHAKITGDTIFSRCGISTMWRC